MLARAILAAALIVNVALGPVSAQERPDIIILFDQSGSVGKHDPKLASKAWLMTFLKTFENPYRFEIVGFDEALYRHLAFDSQSATDADADAVNRAIDGIGTGGKATDLEMPFRYLLNYAKPSTKLAVIISDGEPEIWDVKLDYLSKEVQADARYDDLNRRYQQMKNARVSKLKRAEELSASYHSRNIDLIEGWMPDIANLIGHRLIIWDLSGTSYYLKTWAREAGAQYLPMRVATKENPAEQLQKAMTALQRHSSAIVNEALPDDHEHRAAAALTTIPEIAEKVQPKEQPAPQQAPPPVETPEAEPVAPQPMVTLAAPQVEHAQQPAPAHTPAERTPIWGVVLVVGGVIGAWMVFRRRPAAKAGRAVPVDLASQYIDSKVKDALDDAELLRRKLLIAQNEAVKEERRFSLRVLVPSGAMEIQWICANGETRQTPAIDISMHGVKFETHGAVVNSVTKIICPHMGVVLGVKKSMEIRRDESRSVALLIEFESNIDDWMRWVEIITRIDQVHMK